MTEELQFKFNSHSIKKKISKRRDEEETQLQALQS